MYKIQFHSPFNETKKTLKRSTRRGDLKTTRVIYVIYVISATMPYSLYIVKTVKRQIYCIIMRRYFSRVHKEKGSERALRLDSVLETVYTFHFLFAFFILEF